MLSSVICYSRISYVEEPAGEIERFLEMQIILLQEVSHADIFRILALIFVRLKLLIMLCLIVNLSHSVTLIDLCVPIEDAAA